MWPSTQAVSDLPHLRIVEPPRSHPYTYRGGGGGGEFSRPPRDRFAHAEKLRNDLRAVEAAARQRGLRQDDPLLMTYEMHPGTLEIVKSLERQRSGIILLNVIPGDDRLRATVRVPSGKTRIFKAVIDRYETQVDERSGRPRNQDLVDNIDAVRLATEQDLWTDTAAFPPPDLVIWWEVWLYHEGNDVRATHAAFREAAEAFGLRVKPRFITFPDRVVLLVGGSYRQWASSPRLFLSVAELRRAKEVATEYVDLTPRSQSDIITGAVGRLIPPSFEAPCVCLLDTGVDRNHPLIEPALAESDAQALDPTWGSQDDHPQRHGTAMAGIALYGNLGDIFRSDDPIELQHRLESMKILSVHDHNDPELYGSLTQEAVARVESVSPQRNRAACLTVTADARDGHLPSSWSAAIDQLIAGGEVTGSPKLLCVAAGNLRDQITAPGYEYPMIRSKDCGIEDPGQSWNALTIGAMTDLVMIQHEDFAGHQPIATAGDLAPTSRTSLAWDQNDRQGWPLKPDVVMEGGNWAMGPDDSKDTPEDLGILTTAVHPSGRLLTVTRDTSPATAAAARMAARIWSRYPQLWPETVRGLTVHSARWTNAMLRRFPGSSRSVVQERLRCYGYGVPDLSRAAYSAENVATLLFEGKIQPFRLDGSEVKSNEMHVHTLPWPIEVLQQLGHETVRMRVTLSYFIEPSPGRRGWTRRHRYASHGLRFDLKRATETPDQFLRRLSDSIPEGGDDVVLTGSATQPWVVGPDGRTQGSIHCDWWEGTAAELASAGQLAVYPVTGWWRERRYLNRWGSKARYSLIVTLETDRTDVALYTAIVNQATVSTEVIVEAS